MADQADEPLAPCPVRLGCGWMPYLKHRNHGGFTKKHTQHGPARYLPGMKADEIQAVETATVQTPTAVLSPPPGKAEYVRVVEDVIGWDRGEDATISFAECSGGVAAARSFHGRPMARSNHKLKGTDVG